MWAVLKVDRLGRPRAALKAAMTAACLGIPTVACSESMWAGKLVVRMDCMRAVLLAHKRVA